MDGEGYLEQILFTNGLMAGRRRYRLNRVYRASYHDLETYFGASLMLDGEFDLEIPELGRRQRIGADQTWIRLGQVDVLHFSQLASRIFEEGAVNTTAGLLQSWADDAPRSPNSAVRSLLRQRGPALLVLPGATVPLPPIATRMLTLDTGSLCGRLQFASLALDFLVKLLQAEEGFRERFGQTIGAYVRMRRIEQAPRLIAHEGYGAEQAAYAVGFSSPGWFSAAFKGYFGQLPSSLQRGQRP